MTLAKKTMMPSMKRYLGRMLGCSFGYLGSLFGVVAVIKSADPGLGLSALLAVIPALFVMGMLWAIWSFVRETDEVQRFYITRSMMIGLFAVLAVSGSWGLMEMVVEGLPELPVFWMFPIFFAVMGATQFLNRDQVCLP